jgi:uncharacterized SAM-binding protein YcdF (DUF218 family)
MLDIVWIKALIRSLLFPPTGLLLVCAISLVLQRRSPRTGRALVATGVIGLLLLSTPAVGDWLALLLERSPPLDATRLSHAQAIVILGGGVRRDAAEYGGDTLGALTLERVRYGAYLARRSGLPVMVSGGSVLGGASEAELMRAALENEFRIPVRWIETRSRTTRENAAYSAAILRNDGVQRIALVAHAFDMHRAMAEFGDERIDVVAAPTGVHDTKERSALDFVPSMAGLQRSYYVSYELAANLVRAISR